jgi:hypothetical protein
MSDTTGISVSTFTNRNVVRHYNEAHTAESGEPGSKPDDRVTPDSNPAGYDLPTGDYTVHSQPGKREVKRSATAAQTGPAQQSKLGRQK